MIEESRGQISIEFILLVGAILTMVLVAIPMALKNAEMNKALTAARDGAVKAAALRGLGYSYKGGNATGVVRVLNLTAVYRGEVGNKDWYLLRFYVSVPSGLDASSVCTSIQRQATSHLKYAFEGQWASTMQRVNGSYYSFTVGCVSVA